MRKTTVAALATWLAGAGLAIAQQPVPYDYPAGPAECTAAPTCEPGCCCPPRPCFWFGAEYLLWDLKDSPLPVALITTGPADDPVPGGFGQPGTVNLFGGPGANENLGGDLRSGVRVRGGAYSPDMNLGFEACFFWVAGHTDETTVASFPTGLPVLARPVIAETGVPVGVLHAVPGLSAGGLHGKLESNFWGANPNLTTRFGDDEVAGTLLVGFRYMDLDEELTIDGSRTLLAGAAGNLLPLPASVIFDRDEFEVNNRFYGGQVGVQGTIDLGDFVFWARGAVALGVTVQELEIHGSTTLRQPSGTVASVPNGLLAYPGNSGEFDSTKFAVVPSVELTMGYRVLGNVLVFGGYDFLYWTGVVRPGEQVNVVVDPQQVPVSPVFDPTVATRQAVSLRSSDFWAQGLHFGVAVTY